VTVCVEMPAEEYVFMSMVPAVIWPLLLEPLKVSTPPTRTGSGCVSPVPVPLSKPLSRKAY